MRRDADRAGDLAGADVGRIGEDLRHADRAVHRVIVVDGGVPVVQRVAHVHHGVEIVAPGIERHRDREGLEGRPHLEQAVGEAIEHRAWIRVSALARGAIPLDRLARVVRIEVGLRRHGDHFAGAHRIDQAHGGARLELLLGGDQLVAQRMLDAQVEREHDRLLLAVGCKARPVQLGEAVPVDPLLDADDALVLDIDVAELVRDLRAVGIDTLVLGEEADGRNAEAMDLRLLLRRDLAPQPGEAALAAQAQAQIDGVEIGEDLDELGDLALNVEDAARLGIERGPLHVGRQDLAVAVDDLGARGRDRVAAAAFGRMTVGRNREDHELAGDDAVDHDEAEHREAEPGARLAGAVDVAAVEQRLHEPAMPRRRGRGTRLRIDGGRDGRCVIIHVITIHAITSREPASWCCRSDSRARACRSWRRSDRARRRARRRRAGRAGGRARRTAGPRSAAA